ncbi:hypothetical protein AAFX91_14235 [Bradyrhizobium sp. 31Argb]|uniref:hypothetical protein n=1 Tax=Bradyrhizobium sp. 31Argb TaxID=3141247 RepID=UPI0037492EF0
MAQDHWHFCKTCSSLFFDAGQNEGGVCVDGQSKHEAQGFNFSLSSSDEIPTGQDDWFFCRKCNCLFFVGAGGNPGECAKGGGHDGAGSFNFVLPHDNSFID